MELIISLLTHHGQCTSCGLMRLRAVCSVFRDECRAELRLRARQNRLHLRSSLDWLCVVLRGWRAVVPRRRRVNSWTRRIHHPDDKPLLPPLDDASTA